MSDDDPRELSQKNVFQFLRDKYSAQEIFTLPEFQKATGFSDVSFRTYMSKQFRSLLVPVGSGNFRVSLGFSRFATWQKFKNNVVTQNRFLATGYEEHDEHVMIFDFFMPLRNEEYLRDALDGLFYKDSIKFLLRLIPTSELTPRFKKESGESDDAHLERICAWISKKFIGYSISQVDGRYRALALRTRGEVSKTAANASERYLVDETTAVVRFIFPCSKPSGLGLAAPDDEADLIRWFFNKLFVQSILEVVSSEDQIWLLESGLRNRLHIYRANQ